MDEKQVHDIAQQVFHDTTFYIALISLLAVVIGSALTTLGNYLNQKAVERAETKRDAPRRKMLRQMLEDGRFADHWRKLDTLMHVIGTDEGSTTRLLLEIDARGSEDGQRLWGLLKYHPLKNTP